jgi:signal transduction histidine kinase
VPNASNDEHFERALQATQSLYVLPLQISGDVIGVISLDWAQPDGLTDRSRVTLQRLVTQFENVLAVLDTREKALLGELEESLSANADTAVVAKDSVDRIRAMFRARACSLFLRVKDGDGIRLVASTGPKPDIPLIYRTGEGLTGWVALNMRPLRLRNTADAEELRSISSDLQCSQKWAEAISYEGARESRSFLAVPMRARAELVGVLRLTIKEDDSEFSIEEETLLQEIADRLGAAINTAERNAATNAALLEMEQQANVERQIAEAESLQAICEVLAGEFMRSTRAVGVYFQIRDNSAFRLRLAVGGGILRAITSDLRDSNIEIIGDTQQPMFHERVSTLPEWTPILHLLGRKYSNPEHLNIQSAAFLPFDLDEQKTISALIVLCWHQPQSFSPSQRQALLDLARRASAGLRPSALQRRTQIELEREIHARDRLRDIGLAFAQTHNLDELMHNVLTTSIAESGLERGAIRLFDDTRTSSVLKAVAGFPGGEASQGVEAINVPKWLLRSEKCVFILDTDKDERWVAYRATIDSTDRQRYINQIGSLLGIPIRLRDACMGIVLLESTRVQSVPSQVLVNLEILGLYAAVAIDLVRVQDELQRRMEVMQPFAMGGTMLSGFLHVMRNRINDLFAILANVSDPVSGREGVGEKLNMMRLELKKLQSVCNDLAHFTQTDSISPSEVVSLNPLISRTLGDFGTSRGGVVEFELQAADPSPAMSGNPIQLEIAFKMIVQNAIEAMPHGGRLIVRTWQADNNACLSFSDSGCGMDAATRLKCMDPFFTTKDARGGSGLGLTVVRSIVARHGGKIEVESQPGLGSTFTLSFGSKGADAHAEHSGR